jgi:molybdate transport system substrate-binding protein
MKSGHLLLAGLALFAGACQSNPDQPLTVGAAASFTLALDEIGPAFGQVSGAAPTISIGSTGQLAQQIRNGAPFDLFLAADATHIDQLIEDGFILPESRTRIAFGRLVVIGTLEQSLELDSMDDLATHAAGRIAIANPDHAPYGLAAIQALENSGMVSLVENRIIYAETVRQAAQMVESGNADIGIVAASVVTDRVLAYFTVPQTLFNPIEHVAGILSNSPHRLAAMDFLAFMLSPIAQRILGTSGFEPAIPVEE